jgi:hypothetical protein
LLALPVGDRVRLAQLLLASIEGCDPDAAAAWDEEIGQRAAALDRGTVAGVPAADVFAAVEQKLRR